MDDRSEALAQLLRRTVMIVPWFAMSLYLFIPLRLVSILSPLPLVVAAVLISHPVTALISRNAGVVFTPATKKDQVSLMFSIPESRIMDGEYEKAMEQYREMMLQDRRRLEVYMRMMDLAFTHMQEPARAREILALAMKNLKKLEKREVVSREYVRLLTLFREEHPERSPQYDPEEMDG